MKKGNVKRVKASDLELQERVVDIKRVTKVTKGGRDFGFSALVVVGDQDGIVGYGMGKAKEVAMAISKGMDAAKKNLIKVPILHGTIPHKQYAKFSAARVLIRPASNGTGVIAGGPMRAVLESAGISDVLAKSLGTSNPPSVVKGTVKALTLLRDPVTIAEQRGIPLDRVFNG